MTQLSSSNLYQHIRSAGITYIPADRIFYKTFPYKIELSPKFKGMGASTGKRGCQIDVSNPSKARVELATFNEKMDKILQNVEHRNEIKEFVSTLPVDTYKQRVGGENSLFYFSDFDAVSLICSKYTSVINSVTGPLNDAHAEIFAKSNIVMREQLYYKKFRYVLEFKTSKDFATNLAPTLLSTLDKMPTSTWRAYKLNTVFAYYADDVTLSQNPYHHFMRSGGFNPPSSLSPPATSQIYLLDPQDYVYLKLMAGHYIKSSHEVKLFSELT